MRWSLSAHDVGSVYPCGSTGAIASSSGSAVKIVECHLYVAGGKGLATFSLSVPQKPERIGKF